MKTVSILIALLVFFFMFEDPVLAKDTKSVTLKVEGMTCRLCAPAVKKALERVEGVRAAEVNFKKKEAYVEYEEGKATVEDMIKAVEGVGFKARAVKGG